MTRIARKATFALLQSEQIVGRTWRFNQTCMRWIYNAMVQPVIAYACTMGWSKKQKFEKLMGFFMK